MITKNIKVAFPLLLSILWASHPHAAIITDAGTTGLDLQGLEWLTFDETLGNSRKKIEAGSGGFFANGFRYATRKETETLINSAWGGVHSGWSSNNYQGANAFITSFGVTFNSTYDVFVGHEGTAFIFGAASECFSNAIYSCLGTVKSALSITTAIDAHNIIEKKTELAFDINIDPVGFIHEYYGADFGYGPWNYEAENNLEHPELASLLVRDPSLVPLPPSFLLFIPGLFGLMGLHYKQSRSVA